MDIVSVQKKLNEHEYSTFEDFDKDVRLIWKNAMTYNPKNSAIYGWTLEISKFYDGLVKTETENDKMRKMKNRVNNMDSGVNGANNKRGNRYKSPNMDMPLTYQEKKNLSRMIRSLETEHLLGVWEIVSEGNDQIKNNEIEFDIETLPVRKARELEKYVQGKLELMSKIRSNQMRRMNQTVEPPARTFQEDQRAMGVNPVQAQSVVKQPAPVQPIPPSNVNVGPVAAVQPSTQQIGNQQSAQQNIQQPGPQPVSNVAVQPQVNALPNPNSYQAVNQTSNVSGVPVNQVNVNMNWNNQVTKSPLLAPNRKDSDSSFISSLDDSDGD